MNLSQHLLLNPKTNLIFDFDGTLFKLVLPWDEALDRIKEELITLDESLFLAFKKGELTLSDTQNLYVNKFGERLVTLFRENDLWFEKNRLESIIPNLDLINFLKSNNDYRLSIWSSNAHETVTNILKKNNLKNKFTSIITRDDVKFLKPVPEGLKSILLPNQTKSEYLLIGDTDSDELAARNSGIDFYLVKYFN